MKRAQPLRFVTVQGRSGVPIAARSGWLRAYLCGDSRGGESMRHVQHFVDEVRTELNLLFDNKESVGSQPSGDCSTNHERQAFFDEDEQEKSDDDSQGSQPKRPSEPRVNQEFRAVKVDGEEIMASLAHGTGIVVGSDRETLQRVMTILQKRIESHSMPELRRRKSRPVHDENKDRGGPIIWLFRGTGSWQVKYTGRDGKSHFHSRGLSVPLHHLNGILMTEPQRKAAIQLRYKAAQRYFNDNDMSDAPRLVIDEMDQTVE